MLGGGVVLGVCGQDPAAFIEHGTSGLLVPPRDVEALARQLEAVIHEPAAFRGIAAVGARVAVEKFNWHGHARSLVGVYREALEASC
jgi:glycosyltransferase involved in cell wall biosynthesis